MKQREYKLSCKAKNNDQTMCEYKWSLRTTIPLNDTMTKKLKCPICRKREIEKQEIERGPVV